MCSGWEVAFSCLLLGPVCLVTQSCLTPCDPMNCSQPGTSDHGFSREEYWSGLPCPPAGHLPNPGIEPKSRTLRADSLSSEPPVLLKPPLHKKGNTVTDCLNIRFPFRKENVSFWKIHSFCLAPSDLSSCLCRVRQRWKWSDGIL